MSSEEIQISLDLFQKSPTIPTVFESSLKNSQFIKCPPTSYQISGQYKGVMLWLPTAMSSFLHTAGGWKVLRLWASLDNTLAIGPLSDDCFTPTSDFLSSFHVHLLMFFSINKPIYNSEIKSELKPSVSVYQVLENTLSSLLIYVPKQVWLHFYKILCEEI